MFSLRNIINLCPYTYFRVVQSFFAFVRIPLKAPKRLSEINFFLLPSFIYDDCDN